MKISEELRLEIQTSQNELYTAIYNHQIWHSKHLKAPQNQEFIQKRDAFGAYVKSVAAHQKEVCNRLRRELEKIEGISPDEVKKYIASLLAPSNNNNNNATVQNAPRNDDVSGADDAIVSNGIDSEELHNDKENYEDNVCNGDVGTHENGSFKKARSVSVDTVSADDTGAIEVLSGTEERSIEREMSNEPEKKPETESEKQVSFLENFGLTTIPNATDLSKKYLERKRRSNKSKPQFLYLDFEADTKRKRHCYLQSAGNVPQTRQTTARLKEPSPPPNREEATNSVVPVKAASPPPSSPPASKASSKCLVPTQKASTRPNILRNMSESRVFSNKSLAKMDHDNGQAPATSTTNKTSQSITNSKTVHIPGLPSGLTIERIENDSAVCINCRNPGILTICDNCEANYHVSCHTLSPPPPRLCPKCALKTLEPAASIKRNDELAAASHAPGVVGKAGEDPEIDKTSRGFYKIGTNSKHQIVGASSCINKLSGSTFLIPIVPNTLATSISLPKSTGNVTGFDESRLNLVEPDHDSQRNARENQPPGGFPYTTTILVNNHLSRSTVTYVPQYSVFNQSKKLLETAEETRIQNERPFGSVSSGFMDEGKKSVASIPVVGVAGKQQQQQLQRLTGRVAESLTRSWKKPSKRAVPGLTRIVQSGQKSDARAFVDGNNDNVDQLQKFSYNGRVRGGSRHSNNRRNSRTADDCARGRQTDDYSSRGNGKIAQLVQDSGEPENQTQGNISFENFWPQYPAEKLPQQNFHSLFPSHYKSDNLANCVEPSQFTEGTTSLGPQIRHVPARNDKKLSRNARTSLADGSKRLKNFPPTEHVKLEEAHLPAPSGAKLMRKIQNNDCDSSAYPNRRRTTEERIADLHENGKIERRPMPRILKRNERNKSLDWQASPSNERASTRKTQLASMPLKETKLSEENESPNSSDTSATEEASSPARVSDLDCKTIETNTSPDQQLERNYDDEESGGDNAVIDDEETDDNEEDVEDEEHQDCPIVDEEIREQAIIERLRISTVSPESMQVLQQFESAMMIAEHVDKTANL